jgi:type IV pilus assembly protein PilA
MYQRYQAMKERREGGFTLIELLVVILIIAILAAIAIPVFLNQRQRAYVAQAESALKNAATAAESFATQNNGSYAPGGTAVTEAQLEGEGFRQVTGVQFSVVSATANAYCFEADHDALGTDYFYSSNVGKPSTTVCT